MKKLKNIRIRMYRQGLGDCFLVTITYGQDDKFHILIDCGVIMGTDNPVELMTNIANDIEKETGGIIDVVAITHEHWDHVSGFKQARAVFEKIRFNDVWVAWTEDPKNQLAKRLRKTRADRKKAIENSLTKLKGELNQSNSLTPKQNEARKAYLNAIDEIASFTGGPGVAGGSSTSEALEYVKKKAQSNLYYCSPSSEPFIIKDIEGLRVYILGPPEDEKMIKKDLSEKDVYSKMFISDFDNSFLSTLLTDPDDNIQSKFLPFDRCTGVSIDDAFIPDYYDPAKAWRKIDFDWMDFTGQLALALDSDTNNTSLVIAFEIIDSGKFLLFPGDAQVGNWLSWYNYKWNVTNKAGDNEELDIKKIFERTIFYKVGHHGSHNATLSDKGLELMTNKELSIMIPVDKKMAKKKKWNMPFPPLYKRLNEKSLGRVLVADESFEGSNLKPPNISSNAWKRFVKAVDCTDLYMDLFVDAKKD